MIVQHRRKTAILRCSCCCAVALISLSSLMKSWNAIGLSLQQDRRWFRHEPGTTPARLIGFKYIRYHRCRFGLFSSSPETNEKAPDPMQQKPNLQLSQASSLQSLEKDRSLGVFVLFTVPFAWGTFEPAVRYVYAIEPPVPGLLFSLAYYLVASISLLIVASCLSVYDRDKQSRIEFQNSTYVDPGTSSGSSAPVSWPILGGMELGSYLFIGNALQVIGLRTVPSDRAAILLQLTTVFVPLLEAAKAQSLAAVTKQTWIACLVALFGVWLMGLDGQEIVKADQPIALSVPHSWISQFSTGDGLVVAAAMAYTMHCVRLQRYAQQTSAVHLAACKATMEALLSAMAVGVSCLWWLSSDDIPRSTQQEVSNSAFVNFFLDTGEDIVVFTSSLSNGIMEGSQSVSTLLPAAAAVFWTGWVTIAYTIVAQSYGQARVKPVTANLIYTIQPVCTAILAYVLLGERLGPIGYLGGTVLAAAVLLVALPEREK